jgi:hypothetical protein
MYKLLLINIEEKVNLFAGETCKVNNVFEEELKKVTEIEILIHEEYKTKSDVEDRYYQIENDYEVVNSTLLS